MAPTVEAGTGWLWRLFLCGSGILESDQISRQRPWEEQAIPWEFRLGTPFGAAAEQDEGRGGWRGPPKAVSPEGEAELLSSLPKEDHNFSLVHEQGRGGTQWPER